MLFGSTPMEELSKTGQREKLGCDTVTTKSWLVPWVNSGAETALQIPELRQSDQSLDVR